MFATLLQLLLALAISVSAGFDSVLWTANTPWSPSASNDPDICPVITDVVTTLQVPEIPSGSDFSIWPGLATTDYGLTQFLLMYNDFQYAQDAPCEESSTTKEDDRICSDPGWCAGAYQFYERRESSASAGVIVEPGDLITIEYHWDGQNMNQIGYLASTGRVLAELTRPTGGGKSFGPDVECHGDFLITTPAHSYFDTTITLSRPWPYLQPETSGATPQEIFSNDGGITYYIPEIHFEESECHGP